MHGSCVTSTIVLLGFYWSWRTHVGVRNRDACAYPVYIGMISASVLLLIGKLYARNKLLQHGLNEVLTNSYSYGISIPLMTSWYGRESQCLKTKVS